MVTIPFSTQYDLTMESTFSLELSILCSTDADSLPNFTTVADTPSDARDSVELDVVVLIIPIENVPKSFKILALTYIYLHIDG